MFHHMRLRRETLRRFYVIEPKIIFWDFDGVIKDSVNVKAWAFMNLFDKCNNEIKERIRLHHESNGGMSRYDKIPIYLKYMNLKPTKKLINRYSEKFSSLVVEKVITSPWVPGVLEYLKAKKEGQLYFVTSATPTDELIYILKELNILSIFDDVFGSPITKAKAIENCLKKYQEDPKFCLMYGDAKQDFIAAKENGIPFILRQHDSNQEFKKQYKGISIKDFHEAPR